jgi:hypothetical protein
MACLKNLVYLHSLKLLKTQRAFAYVEYINSYLSLEIKIEKILNVYTLLIITKVTPLQVNISNNYFFSKTKMI